MKIRATDIQYLITAFLYSLLMLDGMAQNSVTLNVHLYPIQTLVVNPSQQDVTLNYITKEEYSSGVSAVQTDHLTIYSTGGFQVKVSTSGELSGKDFPLNSISVIPSSGSKPIAEGNVEYHEKNISQQEQPIITSTRGGIDKNFNINYKGAGANMYIDYYSASDAPAVYSYDVVYTIVSQ